MGLWFRAVSDTKRVLVFLAPKEHRTPKDQKGISGHGFIGGFRV